ncbi:MAG: hypothetical protein ACJ8F3_22330 [Xanthobacteraceae bacterium]
MDDQEPRVETARERRIANLVLLGFVLAIVLGGLWLANAMVEHRAMDNCLAQGGHNCLPVETPSR